MQLDQLLDELHKLSRVDKLRVVQILMIDLASEDSTFLKSGTQYERWSSLEAYEAAKVLMGKLKGNT